MKITALKVTVQQREAAPRPIRDALQALPGAGSVRVTIHTDEGTSGSGQVGFGRVSGAPVTLGAFIEQVLRPLIVGADPTFVRGLHEVMLRETEYHGSFGLAMFGIAAVDTAIWDCLGNTSGVPCWQLWGAVRRRVPAYAMVGWLNYDEAEVRDICARAVAQGFPGVKIKVGFPTLKQDVQRLAVVREAIGDEVDLMVDANQSLTTKEALRRGRVFQELGCYWWEEPLPADDIEGYVRLASALDMPIATGENLYTRFDFARFLKHEAVDIVQPDLRRAGGPTSLLQIGTMADAFRRPYASHGGDPIQISVMACLPNAIYLETGLIPEGSPMKLEEGSVALPQGPGFAWE